ncbi:MAG TPA: methyltransferase domain-containing protein [Gammaproteobacteria bacterium]
MNIEDLQAYHKTITDTYDERSTNHDKSEWHRNMALRLVEDLPPRPGDSVLDIATGTGTIAFHTASLVGPNGKVVGIDLSEGMLTQANAKLSASGLRNLEFILADAENLKFPPNSFDRMYCASAFFWILDPVATLKHWRDLLKPGGRLGLHALPDTCCVWVTVARQVLANYGISYVLNEPTGTMDKCRQLLVDSGFKNIDIREENVGKFIPLEQAKSAWIKKDDFSPGQHPNPLVNVSPKIVAQAQRDYEARLDALNTDQGVWNDLTSYYIYGQK